MIERHDPKRCLCDATPRRANQKDETTYKSEPVPVSPAALATGRERGRADDARTKLSYSPPRRWYWNRAIHNRHGQQDQLSRSRKPWRPASLQTGGEMTNGQAGTQYYQIRLATNCRSTKSVTELPDTSNLLRRVLGYGYSNTGRMRFLYRDALKKVLSRSKRLVKIAPHLGTNLSENWIIGRGARRPGPRYGRCNN